MKNFEYPDKFVNRHNGPDTTELSEMLKAIGVESTEELINKTIPANIRLEEEIELDAPLTEYQFLKHLRSIADKNKVFDSYIGMGYYPTITPSVILRNIFENPGWYTQYTPYQAEISQGRLEALLNFQTMVMDMTGLPLANASLLDEGTAAAEAMGMFHAVKKGPKKAANTFLVSDKCFPQTIDVMKTRALPLRIDLKVVNTDEMELTDDVFGILVQYPDGVGEVRDYTKLFNEANEKGVFVTAAADLLGLALLTPPGELGADCVVGSAQRFGVPMGYGGPHAAFFATKEEYKRQIPGRIIGVSVDSNDNPALRMALQTREQHIRREKATSNICTAQVLLAIMAGMYAAYHGPEGIKAIAQRVHNLTALLNAGLKDLGYKQLNKHFFDTLKIEVRSKEEIKAIALDKEINLRYFEGEEAVGITVSEVTDLEDVLSLLQIFAELQGKRYHMADVELLKWEESIQPNLQRKSEYLTHPVFNKYQTETEMMRYIKSLEKKDLSLTHSMIPLGSCTMKLNAAAEMEGISWAEFGGLHPFIPANQAEGYKELFTKFEEELAAVTGYDSISLQPNSGAQGEFTGLMVIRSYQEHVGEGHRNICLIPSSAHGTNPASAVMAGCKVVVVKCDDYGNIDTEDLKAKAEQYKDTLSSIMVTYPSTHGVFEENMKEICEIVHANGGQVYMDGANLNAQLGYTHPGIIGADVCHLNLHKTFCIPHGGGGPGMGPIGVAKHLTPFLPSHSVVDINGSRALTAVSAAPWGSASILPISYGYIRMMGIEGLKKATAMAIVNANYIKTKLEPHYKVLYSGRNGFVGHELIFDTREFKQSANVEVEDIAKRLMDYGYHAPTVSFPVPGTLMVEPTESESKEELDRFCEAMMMIRHEIEEIEQGIADKENNLLKNAPHTAEVVATDEWERPYSREKAVFPAEWTIANKFWPSVGRVNNAYGDRNLVCSCLPISEYEEEPVA